MVLDTVAMMMVLVTIPAMPWTYSNHENGDDTSRISDESDEDK